MLQDYRTTENYIYRPASRQKLRITRMMMMMMLS